ncbi:MAG TPA: tryptophan--tRNA ligase [Firmicutes bacterium]|nr:tryptophan--tRNA ligase [Bacillota bacterium]
MMNIILTGDRPTGKLHLGHYIGSLKNRVVLQNEGNYDEMYLMIADSQALTDNFDNPKKVRDNIINVALDYLSVGIDPKKVNIFIQSQIPALTELSFYYMNLVTVSRLQRNPTVKNEIKEKSFEKSIPVGFFCYPISQAADITAFKANIIPVGNDQLPMLEQTNEIVSSFNRIYGETLVPCKAILNENKIAQRLPGLDGNAKMSKSLNNGIYLSDPSDVIYKKVMSMYTDPNHIKVEDPGKVEGNMVFTYLDVFSSDEQISKYSEYRTLDEMKKAYEKGGLGDVKIKKVLYNILEEILSPIREKRKYYEEHLDEVYSILKEGTTKANEKANKTLKEVKKAIMIDFFEE